MANLSIYSKNGYTIYKYDFYSLDDYLKELITKKINTNIFFHPSSIYGSYDFTGTHSFEEAWNLCKYTYDDGYKKFSNLVSHIEYKFENISKYVDKYKPVGTSPSVPRFLFGIPDNMHTKVLIKEKPVINIYFQYGYNWTMSSNQIINRGILTLAFINYLENVKKFNVVFNFISLSKENNEIIYSNIVLKNKDEKLKVKQAYFPIVHPSFLRRLNFRLEEIIPELKNNWNEGYGYSLNYPEILNFIETDETNSIFISTPDQLGIYGVDIEEDAKNFINNINVKYDFLNKNVESRSRKR